MGGTKGRSESNTMARSCNVGEREHPERRKGYLTDLFPDTMAAVLAGAPGRSPTVPVDHLFDGMAAHRSECAHRQTTGITANV